MAGVGDLLGARSGDRDADGETWIEALMSKPTHLHLTRWAAALVSRALHGVDNGDTVNHITKHNVLAVQPGLRSSGEYISVRLLFDSEW